ncbi:SURF1 family protein [Microbacterium sp. NPDC055357]
MLRPQWIGMLLLCLVVAGVFAWLGQWQLSNAIDTDPPPPGATEVQRPLADVAGPGEYVPEPLVGQRVEVEGAWVPGNFLIVASRFNGGEEGFWVTGQLRIAGILEPTSIAVAVGWAPTLEQAQTVAAQLDADAAAGATVSVQGRLISDEGPASSRSQADPFTMTRMATPALLSRWHDTEGLDVYRAYIASPDAPAGLVDIDSPPPTERSPVNWLNIFYAAEWAIFAGFAFYLWYRLAKDAWQKELEDLEDAASEGERSPAQPG